MSRMVLLLLLQLVTLNMSASYLKVVGVKTTLNVRSDFGSDSPVVGKLSNGAIVEFIGESDPEWGVETGEMWFQIRNDEVQGWVNSSYLEETEEIPNWDKSKTTESSKSWSDYLPDNDYLRAAVYIILFIVGCMLLALVVFLVIFLLSIGLYAIGGAALLGIVGYAMTTNVDRTISWMVAGLILGAILGVYKLITDPDGAFSDGISAASGISGIFSSSSGSNSSSSSSSSSSNSSSTEYDTIITKGGTYGEDIKAKSGLLGTLKDENGKTWERRADGSVEKID